MPLEGSMIPVLSTERKEKKIVLLTSVDLSKGFIIIHFIVSVDGFLVTIWGEEHLILESKLRLLGLVKAWNGFVEREVSYHFESILNKKENTKLVEVRSFKKRKEKKVSPPLRNLNTSICSFLL